MKATPLVNINAKHNNSDGLYDYMKREIERLNEYISFYEDLSKKQNKEIDRLKESEEYHRKGYAELYKRIDDAIEYIEEALKDDYSEFMYMYEPEEILKILKGE